jgi:hypothetical protein
MAKKYQFDHAELTEEGDDGDLAAHWGVEPSNVTLSV